MNVRRTMVRLTVTLAMLCSLVSSVDGQGYTFKIYGSDQGLENVEARTILQDRTGFLWVGTANGLFRYDGRRFKQYSTSDGLPSAAIECLHESIDGILWVGTPKGIARRSGDHFEPVDQGKLGPVVGRFSISSDKAGHLYVATESGLAIGLTGARGLEFNINPAPGAAGTQQVHSVAVDRSGKVWFGCGQSICKLEGERIVVYDADAGVVPDRWDALVVDSHGNLWARSLTRLIVRHAASDRFNNIDNQPQQVSDEYASLTLDNKGRLWLPTKRGLAWQSGSGWHEMDSSSGLPADSLVRAIFQDREGSLWLALSGRGLARWLGYGEWTSWTHAEGLRGESVSGITLDSSGKWWVGTNR